MNYITVILLTLMDEESAFVVLSTIIRKILPKHFYAGASQGSALMGFHQEKFVLCHLTKQYLNLNEQDFEKVKNFFEVNSPSFLIPLLVNFLNFQMLIATWNQMMVTQSVRL